MNRVALIRRPGPLLADGIVTHIERVPVDQQLAVWQWEGYAAAMAAAGWDLIEVPPADDCPDGVFVEDTLVMYRDAAIITRPGAAARGPEIVEVAKVVARLGLPTNQIEWPGYLDGGDVLKVGDTVYVGVGGRTNAAGVAQLAAFLEPLGAEVIPVPVHKVLHLKSAVTALPDESIIGYLPLVDDVARFPKFRPVPEESGSHVVLLGGRQLLMAADAPRSAQMFAELGYEPVTVDISEFQKLEGCVTCLSVRIRDAGHGLAAVSGRRATGAAGEVLVLAP